MYTNVLEYLEANSNIENSACALSDEKEQVTYGQLKELAQRTGSFIAKQGNWTGRPIAVLIDRNVWSIVLFMGIVYSGNFYVPIDPTMPAKRIELILDTLQPVMILSAVEGKTIEGREVYTKEDCFAAEMDRERLAQIRLEALDTDPLYAIFTSGSTGTPKGVLICLLYTSPSPRDA